MGCLGWSNEECRAAQYSSCCPQEAHVGEGRASLSPQQTDPCRSRRDEIQGSHGSLEDPRQLELELEGDHTLPRAAFQIRKLDQALFFRPGQLPRMAHGVLSGVPSQAACRRSQVAVDPTAK